MRLAEAIKEDVLKASANVRTVRKRAAGRHRKRTVFRVADLDFAVSGVKISGNVRLYRRSNGRWYVRFTLNGKRRMLSTGEADKDRALLKLGEIVKETAQKDEATDGNRVTTYEQLVNEYLPYAETNKAPSTYKKDKPRLRKLAAKFGDLRLTEITPRKVEQHMQERRKEVQPATVNREVVLLKHTLNKAVDWGYLKDNPIKRVKQLKEPPGRIRYLSHDERERLLDACKHSKSRMLYPTVLTAMLTGLRRGELRELTWDDVSLSEERITVRNSKNNESRIIPIHREVLEVLQSLRNGYSYARYVICKPDGSRYGTWRRAFETAVKRAGIKDFHFHDLRHTFGSYLGMQGCNAYTIMKLMGHKTLAMSVRYTHLSDEHLRTAIDGIELNGAKVVQSITAQN